jgi:hypothetical protein
MTRKGRPLANGSDRRRLLTLWPPPIHIYLRKIHIHETHTHTRAQYNNRRTIIIEWHLHVYNRYTDMHIMSYYSNTCVCVHILSVYTNSAVNDEWGGEGEALPYELTISFIYIILYIHVNLLYMHNIYLSPPRVLHVCVQLLFLSNLTIYTYLVCGYETAAAAAVVITQHACTTRISVVLYIHYTHYTMVHIRIQV